MRFRNLALASAVLLVACQACSNTRKARASTCAEAARSAEQRDGLPPGLLMAIGDVESGGWGWSVNGNDGSSGHRFATAEDALRYTEGLLGSGLRTIDVGCFQIDLRYHPEAFGRWQDAFNGDTSADAAATILNRLHAETGDWSRAVALYHSADLQRGQSYLQAVMSAWSGGFAISANSQNDRTHEIELRPVSIPVAVWGPDTILTAGDTRRHRDDKLPRIITP